MADEKKQDLAKVNPIQQLERQLAEAKSVKEIFSIDLIRERFIKNYESVTGRKDGENRYNQERFAYLEIIADKPELNKVDKFYHFAAIVKAGTTGLSFRDGKLYVIPTGVGVKVQSSPAGKREQLEMMPTIKRVPEPVLVMKGDHFIHDKMNGVVKEHYTTDKSSTDIKLENIFASYQRIIYKDGTVIDTVVYHDDLVKAKDKSKMKSDQGLWQTWPGEASKKTSTNRSFRLHHKYPDNVVLFGNEYSEESESEADVPYANTVDTTVIQKQSEPDPNATVENFHANVNESTGEVYPTEEVKEQPKIERPKREPLI